MFIRIIIAGLVAAASVQVTTGNPPVSASRVGMFTAAGDVGAPALPGRTAFDASERAYRVTGGAGRGETSQFVWTQHAGDLHLGARVDWAGGGGPRRTAGVMIRRDLGAASPYAAVVLHGSGLVAMQFREVENGPVAEIRSGITGAKAVRLEREGDYVFFSVAGADGTFRHAGGNYRIALGDRYHAGLFVSSNDARARASALFRDVTLRVPRLKVVPDTGYPAAVESTLEVMDVAEPHGRRVVRHFNGRIEAPNWTRDGSSLIYNGGGRLYRIGLDGGEPVVVDTGPRTKNNNDHGLSPDGTRLAISDQSEPDGLSRIYVMPLAGSRTPRLVAGHPAGPSYWHGWSPDGRTLAYTASRPETNDYDIYARDLAGGPERRLTTAPGLDDGPEYSPDGRHLYFNSVRSGDMRIWRMRTADGADPEQVTHDAGYRDWFPHVSPDGKWIAFVSFGMDVALGDHPPNRDVVIRIMPADGSAKPRVLTRLFGGQGTMNVPSWSPDSRRIAFVSYRLVR